MSVDTASLSLVLPTRNNAAGLVATVRECLQVLPTYFSDYEIIIVDDGSQDAAAERADYLAVTYDPVMVIHHAHPLGYGRALVTGLSVARGDYLLCLDVTNPAHLPDLAPLLACVDQYDVIVGHCVPEAAQVGREQRPFLRLVNWLFALDLQDIGCRLMLFRAGLFQPAELVSPSPLVHVEMYARATHQGAARVQVGVPLAVEAATTRREMVAPGVWSLWEMLQLRLHLGQSAPAPTARPPFWRQKTALGAGAVAVAGGIWFLLRRRG